MTDSVKEQLSACLDGELPAAELDLLLKRLERDAELREPRPLRADRRGLRKADSPSSPPRTSPTNVMAAVEQEPASRRAVARATLSPALLRRLRPVAGIRRRGQRWRRWRSSRCSAPDVEHLAADRGERARPLRRRAVVAQTPTKPAISCRRARRQPAFVPATRLTNYVVAHSEYSSPLGRRSVLTGVLAEDDGDPDVATDDAQEPQSPPTVSRRPSRSLNERLDGRPEVLRRPGRRRAHGDDARRTPAIAKRASGWSACPNRSPPATTKAASFTCATRARRRCGSSIASRRARSPSGWCRSTAAAARSSATRTKSSAICPTGARCWSKSAPTTARCWPRCRATTSSSKRTTASSAARSRRRSGRRTQVILVQPRDQFRYGYRLWLDDETAMPLKSQLCDRNGNVIEQILFAELNFRDRIPADAVKPAVVGRGLPLGAAGRAGAAHGRTSPIGWNVIRAAGRVPPDDVARAGRSPARSAPVRHLVLFGRARLRVGVHRAAHRRRPKRCAGWPRSAPRSRTRATWTVTRSPLSAKCRPRRSRRSPRA